MKNKKIKKIMLKTAKRRKVKPMKKEERQSQ
jgi:hypothetical protein